MSVAIENITDIRTLIELRIKGIKVSGNKLWKKYKYQGRDLLYKDGSFIWKESFSKLLVNDLLQINDDDWLSIVCYVISTSFKKEKELDSQKITKICINVMYLTYNFYCLVNKNYQKLEESIMIDKRYLDTIYHNRINKNSREGLIHTAIKLMDLKAIKLLKDLGCNLDIVVDGKDLRQHVYELKSQVAQRDILNILYPDYRN